MQTKDDALQKISELSKAHNISYEELKPLFSSQPGSSSKSDKVKMVFAYLGGVLIFAGIVLYFSLIWEDLNSIARVVVTFGSGLVTMVLGLAALKDARFIKASTPLFIISAALQTCGLFVFLDEFFDGGDAHVGAMVVFGIMLLQKGLFYLQCRRPSLAFFAIAFGFFFYGTLLDYMDFDHDFSMSLVGFSGLLLTYGMDKSRFKREFAFLPVLYFIFGGLFAFGVYDLIKITPYDFLLLGIGALMIFASIHANSRSLLAMSVISLLCYLSHITDEYFANVIGWPIALIFLGLVMIGISSFAVKLGQRMKNS